MVRDGCTWNILRAETFGALNSNVFGAPFCICGIARSDEVKVLLILSSNSVEN